MFDRLLRTLTPALALLAALTLAPIAPAQHDVATVDQTQAQKFPELASPENAFVWMIEKKGRKPSFLFGTMHAGDERFTKFNDTVKVIFKTADAVYTELPMDEMEEIQKALTTSTMLPAGKSLGDYVDADVLADFHEIVKGYGFPPEATSQFRPVMASMLLQQLPLLKRYGAAKALDEKIYMAAKRAGKDVGGVEVVEEQLAAFNVLSDEEAGRAMRKAVKLTMEDLKTGRDRINELIYYYLLGDEKQIYNYMLEDYDANDPLDVRFMEALLTKRNVVMAERVAKMTKENPQKVYVFAFGTLHFVGPDSVVTMLRDQGYKVTRLTAPKATAEAKKASAKAAN